MSSLNLIEMFTTSVQELRADPDVIMEAMNQDAQVEKPSSRNRKTGCVFVGRGGLFFESCFFQKKTPGGLQVRCRECEIESYLGVESWLYCFGKLR